MNKMKIGRELEGYCRKCKTDTLHVITAMNDKKIAKVMCKVCMSYHKFIPPTESATVTVVKLRKVRKKPIARVERRPRRDKWERLLANMDSDSAIEYQMDQDYELQTAIHHKIFGLGVVKNVIDNQKIEVLFHDGAKLLVQNFQH